MGAKGSNQTHWHYPQFFSLNIPESQFPHLRAKSKLSADAHPARVL